MEEQKKDPWRQAGNALVKILETLLRIIGRMLQGIGQALGDNRRR